MFGIKKLREDTFKCIDQAGSLIIKQDIVITNLEKRVKELEEIVRVNELTGFGPARPIRMERNLPTVPYLDRVLDKLLDHLKLEPEFKFPRLELVKKVQKKK